MGLDMYLTRQSYVKNWDHTPIEHRHEVVVRRGGEVRSDIKPERVRTIIEDVAYWRKANAIHKWFVDHCQEGNDDCGEYYVSRDQLAELVGLCKQVLGIVETVDGELPTGTTYHPDGRVEHHTQPGAVVAQENVAAAILPTQGGFFFGNTEYNDYYLDDLRETVKQIEPLLDDTQGEFYYHSSW